MAASTSSPTRWAHRALHHYAGLHSVLDLDQWARALADQDSDNKNWNEQTRQTSALQALGRTSKATADALEIIAETVIEVRDRTSLPADEAPDLEDGNPDHGAT